MVLGQVCMAGVLVAKRSQEAGWCCSGVAVVLLVVLLVAKRSQEAGCGLLLGFVVGAVVCWGRPVAAACDR